MICHSYDCNYVKAVTIKSSSESEWLKAYGNIHQELTSKGFKPKLFRSIEIFFTENDVDFQLVPPHYHRRNAAERVVRTFKEKNVSGLASVDPDFPLHLWDRLLPQS
jgi:hypothetical protein